MDILSVAGFALNAYSYLKENMAEGENKSGPTPELVAAPPSKGVAYPEGMTVVKSGLIQQKIAVSELLAMDQGKRKPAVMTVRTKDPTDSPRKSKKRDRKSVV